MNGKVSYESILERMLASAPGGVDVGEASIFYDAVVPAAKELVTRTPWMLSSSMR